MASALRVALTRHDMVIDHALNLSEAEIFAADGNHDAVVLDRRLPDGDGLSLVPKLRASGNAVPVLVLTARADLADRIADRFTAYREEEMFVFPGAHEAIDAFKALGIKLALVTNGAADMQRAKVERFALGHRFDHIQIEGEHGFGKPEERAYLHMGVAKARLRKHFCATYGISIRELAGLAMP